MSSQLLDRLRRVEVEALGIDEAVELSAVARQITSEYAVNDIPAPEWLADVSQTLTSNIKSRQRDAQLKRLKEIELEERQLLTAKEKRDLLASEKDRLKARLGMGEPVTQ